MESSAEAELYGVICGRYSNTSANKSRRGSNSNSNSNRRRNKNRRSKKSGATATATAGRSRKKQPTFIGLHHTKVKAVVADEPGLDPLYVQLEKLEKEVTAYASESMEKEVVGYAFTVSVTFYVANAIRNLVHFDFDASTCKPIPVDPTKYTIMSSDYNPPVAMVDEGKKFVLEEIFKQEKEIFVEKKAAYIVYMEQVYEIIYGNIDENIKHRLVRDSSYETVSASNDPIELIKLLRKVCRKEKRVEEKRVEEKRVDWPVSNFISCLTDLLTSEQGTHTSRVFHENTKLKYDIVTSQFGDDWIPSTVKTAVQQKIHDGTTWSGTTYDTCNSTEQAKINTYTKNRIVAVVLENGRTHKHKNNPPSFRIRGSSFRFKSPKGGPRQYIQDPDGRQGFGTE